LKTEALGSFGGRVEMIKDNRGDAEIAEVTEI
jgi:hypothetical protein